MDSKFLYPRFLAVSSRFHNVDGPYGREASGFWRVRSLSVCHEAHGQVTVPQEKTKI